MKALVSVYDKTGLDEFAKELVELGWEILCFGTFAVQAFHRQEEAKSGFVGPSNLTSPSPCFVINHAFPQAVEVTVFV